MTNKEIEQLLLRQIHENQRMMSAMDIDDKIIFLSRAGALIEFGYDSRILDLKRTLLLFAQLQEIYDNEMNKAHRENKYKHLLT